MTENRAPDYDLRPFAAFGAWLGLVAVAAGAFGAHALRGRLDAAQLQIFETAARYQLIHSVALLAIGLASTRGRNGALRTAGISFIAGLTVFSGSLYTLALGGPRWIGVLTPLGGLAMMAGWLALAVGFSTRRSPA